ncbi:MAG TPA: radical SAM protein, partial [Candidatus Latescibacteria bacterium]|nr:radical SAM protein [Candidatus Latescibacterota bacterium]
IAQMRDGRMVEFVESVQPPVPLEKKWVLIVSTLFGCPVGCPMCDAGGEYRGKLSKEEILGQIDYLVRKRFPDGAVPVEKFKVQFARMGEPAFNPAVVEVLDELPRRYEAPGLLPSLSTVAPYGTEDFFEELLDVKRRLYRGQFQLQFSIHSTDPEVRDRLIPARKWGFEEMAEYGERFFEPGDRKVTLNFALAKGVPVEARALLEYFPPELFLIKITPLNPTYRARESGLTSYIDPDLPGEDYDVVRELRESGYEVIVSVGEVEENRIGSNCGQFVRRHIEAGRPMREGYTYPLEDLSNRRKDVRGTLPRACLL